MYSIGVFAMGLPVLVLPEFSCNDVQLQQEITMLSGQINVANYRLLKLIAEFDSRGAWRCGGTVRSCAHWLAAQCGMTIGAARERVRVARSLGALPEVDSAFSTGGLSYSKVRAITRVATQKNEGFMVMMAEQSSASHLEKLVSKFEPVDDLDFAGLDLPMNELSVNDAGDRAGNICMQGEETAAHVDIADGVMPAAAENPTNTGNEEEQREQARELYWFQDKDGMWIIHAKLPPEQGQLVMKTLEAFARPLQEEWQEGWKAAQKARLRAVAKEISRRHRAANNNEAEQTKVDAAEVESTKPGRYNFSPNEKDKDGERGGSARREEIAGFAEGKLSTEEVELERAREKISAETFSQHMNHIRADAIAAMAEHFLATSGDYQQFRGLKGAERCQVVLHVDINTLREQRSGVCCTHGRAHFEDKPWLLPETARRLSCDASLVTVLEDDMGNVLNVGRRSRIVPPRTRRALLERDGACRFPGCHESKYVDAHHIKHWADGGETSLENLVTLCRFHHRQLHRGCFDIKNGVVGLKWVKGVSAEIFPGRAEVLV